MTGILTDFSHAALVKAIEESVFALIFAWGRWPKMRIEDTPEMIRYVSDSPLAVFNGVARARLTHDSTDDKIDETLAFFKARDLPMLWWTGPSTQPADLPERLQAHGLIEADLPPGMALDLRELQPPPTPRGLVISRVADAEMARLFARTCAIGFGGSADAPLDPLYDAMVGIGFDPDSGYQSYTAYLNGEPVATSTMVLGAGVAGIYSVSTVPAARGKGIGAAVTAAPLLEARAKGYRIGILHSTHMGYKVYQRLGFRQYCAIGQYVWTGD